jgi:DNA-directed RNA polymerase subunit beta'
MDQDYFLIMVIKLKLIQKICEWDPYTTPVIAEKSGTASFVDLIDGVSIQETTG